jgi:site-specific DNA recombinase
MPRKPVKKAVIYARFSPRRNEDHCESNEKQLEFCRAYCSERNIEIAGEFQDRALSGSEEDRPGLWSALASLKKGQFFMVYKLDRLARNVYLHFIIEKEIEKAGGILVSVTGEGTEDATAENQLVRTILAALSEYMRRVTNARTKAGMLRNQAAGRRMGRADLPPYGFMTDPADDSRLISNPAETPILSQVCAMRKEGLNLRQIGRKLNEQGVNGRSGRPLHHSVIRAILNRAGIN